ncbi:MAG: hypothetical protein GY831_24975, partial [Delftia sp.]|nr:hypothetical protein [Delftia sp.]
IADGLERTGPGAEQLWQVLAGFLGELGVAFTARQLAELAAGGRLRLLLDGLDELRSELRPVLAEALQGALGKAAGRLQVVLTSRPYALPDAQALPGFYERTILALDDDQQREFLCRYHERLFHAIPERAAAETTKLVEALAIHPTLYELGRTPLMLLGVAVVHYREERLPHGRDEVFRALSEA